MFPAAHLSVVEASNAGDLARALDQIREAVVHVDHHWVVTMCNDAYLERVGLTRAEVIGKTPMEFAPAFARSIFYEAIEQCRQTRKPALRIGFSTVLNRWQMMRVFPLPDGMIMLTNEANEGIVKQYQLAQKVVQDPLTALGNKLGMEQAVEQLLRHDAHFKLTVIGLNRFRDVNDAHGYAAGDMALLEVASALQSATLAGERLFRVSGDEFAVLHQGEAAEVAQRAQPLLEAVSRPLFLNGARVVLSAAAGIVAAPEHGQDYEILLKRAGLALHEAKRMAAGGVPISEYRRELEVASRMRAELEGELRQALDGSQFQLVLQPKVSLLDGGVCGGEALIRWAHPRRGLLAPGAFLDVAEQIGAMPVVDQWVLRTALKAIRGLRGHGLEVPISINVSAESLGDAYFATRVSDALRTEDIPAGLLEIEIPEGALMRDVQASAQVLQELHAMGVRTSIDDFGTGYSSFAYLAQFPVDALKIDRSFVNGMASNEASRTIVKSIVRLAHALSLEVVAEGVETREQMSALRRMKCDVVQGFVHSRPVGLEEFVAFAKAHPARRTENPNTI